MIHRADEQQLFNNSAALDLEMLWNVPHICSELLRAGEGVMDRRELTDSKIKGFYS